MRVVEDRQTLRSNRNHFGQGARETAAGLARQTIDQIQTDGTKTCVTRVLNRAESHRLALNAIDRHLHIGIKILHAEADAIETQCAQMGQGAGRAGTRVDFYGELAVGPDFAAEAVGQHAHQLRGLVMVEKSGRATTPMHLAHHALRVVECGLLPNLAGQRVEIGDGMGAIACHHLVAAAVETHRCTERNVHIERQVGSGAIAGACGACVIFGGVILELRSGRIGCITRAAEIVLGDQLWRERDTDVGLVLHCSWPTVIRAPVAGLNRGQARAPRPWNYLMGRRAPIRHGRRRSVRASD